MNAIVKYDEILAFLRSHSKIHPRGLRMEDARTLCVDFAKNTFPFSLPVTSIRLRIEEVADNHIALSYKNIFSDMAGAITGLIANLSSKVERQLYETVREKLPAGIAIDIVGRRIDIDIRHLVNQSKLCEYMSLADVAFTDSGVTVVIDLH